MTRLVLLLLVSCCSHLAAATLTLDNGTLSYTAGAGAVAISPSAVLGGADFSSGTSLAVSAEFTAGFIAGEDLLQIRASGTVSVSAGTVSVGGTAIGTYSGGSAGTPLVISITAGADPTAVQTLMRSLAFHDIAGSGATSGVRTVQITVTDAGGSVSASRAVSVGPGNAPPALTIGANLAVPRSARVPITAASLLATDAEDAADGLTYELTSLPRHGNLILATLDSMGDISADVVLVGGVVTFTQADIDAGRLRYDHRGEVVSEDGFTVVVRDSDGSATPVTALPIDITGTRADPLIDLPPGTLVCREQGGAEAMEPTAPVALATSVVDADAPHYRGALLVARLVDAQGNGAATTGDTIGVRDHSGATPSQTGYICVLGNEIYIRHSVSGSALPTTTGSMPPDRLLGTIDASDNGVGGRPLRIVLASTVVRNLSVSGDGITSEEEVVTREAVAELLANLTLAHPGDDPPATARFLDIALSEASPNPGSGSAQRPVAVVPVNDAPVFSSATLALNAVVGVPVIVGIVASDPDLPTGASLTYEVLSAPTGFTLDAQSGGAIFFPTAITPPATPVIATVIARDDQGEASAPLTLSITVLPSPTALRPYVVSDPPVELGAGELVFHPFTIVPAAGAGSASTVVVTLVGDVPAGAVAAVASVDQLSWTLTAPGVSRPADGIYTFGMHIAITTGSGTDIGYQPITLVVLDLAGSN